MLFSAHSNATMTFLSRHEGHHQYTLLHKVKVCLDIIVFLLLKPFLLNLLAGCSLWCHCLLTAKAISVEPFSRFLALSFCFVGTVHEVKCAAGDLLANDRVIWGQNYMGAQSKAFACELLRLSLHLRWKCYPIQGCTQHKKTNCTTSTHIRMRMLCNCMMVVICRWRCSDDESGKGQTF